MRLDKNRRMYHSRKWEEEQGLEEAKRPGCRAEGCMTLVTPDGPQSEGTYGRQGIHVRINPQ